MSDDAPREPGDPLAASDLAPVRHPADPPPVSRAALLAAVRACVVIVRPGEVLAVRIPAGWSADRGMTARWQDMAARLYHDQGIRVVFLPGDEFAAIARLKED